MRRLARDLAQGAELVRLLWTSWRYARSEPAENQRLKSLDQMTNERIAAESQIRKWTR